MTERARVVLVGCGAAKLSRRAPARELYTSNLFRMSLTYAQKIAAVERVFVLSAMHGIVPLDQELKPYERKLSDYGGKQDREAWGGRTIGQLSDQPSVPPRGQRGELVMLAGKDYVEAMVFDARDAGWQLVEPLKGLTRGARLAWLRAELTRLN